MARDFCGIFWREAHHRTSVRETSGEIPDFFNSVQLIVHATIETLVEARPSMLKRSYVTTAWNFPSSHCIHSSSKHEEFRLASLVSEWTLLYINAEHTMTPVSIDIYNDCYDKLGND